MYLIWKYWGRPPCAFGPNPILPRLCLSWKISARRGLHHATPPVTQGVGLQCVISFCETVNILAFSDKHRVLGPFLTSIPKRIWLFLHMDITHFYNFVNTDKNTLINIWKVQWKRDMHEQCTMGCCCYCLREWKPRREEGWEKKWGHLKQLKFRDW